MVLHSVGMVSLILDAMIKGIKRATSFILICYFNSIDFNFVQ